jgi:uncharacterized protein involved in exopolysaccharide biosynthesis
MGRYLATAGRYRWTLAVVLTLVWCAGLAAAYVGYVNTFESTATIWVLRASPELLQPSANDLTAAIPQTAAAQQADLIDELLQTTSFVRDVVKRTSLAAGLAAAPDATRYLDGVRKRFRVQAPGSNVLTVSYSGSDPRTGPEMVDALLAVRADRVAQARVVGSAALNALYQKQYDAAQGQALDAQRQVDQFNASHPAPLSDVDQHLQAQLRLTLDLAQARLTDLRGNLDRAALAPAILDISGLEFQVVDEPSIPTSPSGGAKSAMTLAMVAIAAGLALDALFVLLATLLLDRRSSQATRGAEAAAEGDQTAAARGRYVADGAAARS